MTQEGPKLEDVKLVVEPGSDGHRVLAQEESGTVVLAEGLSRDYAERIVVAWNFCAGFDTAPLRQANLQSIMSAPEPPYRA
jgi:hypothetical protein